MNIRKTLIGLLLVCLTTGPIVWGQAVSFGGGGGAISFPVAPGEADGPYAPVAWTGVASESGIAWPDPRFTDNGDGTVTDNLSGLMWPDTFPIDSTPRTYADTLLYASSSTLGGHSDWRIPTNNEIASLLDWDKTTNSNGGLIVDAAITNNLTTSKYVWGSQYNADNAWRVRIENIVFQVVGNTAALNTVLVRGDIRKGTQITNFAPVLAALDEANEEKVGGSDAIAKIDYTKDTFADIKAAIASKSVDMTGVIPSGYDGKIAEISVIQIQKTGQTISYASGDDGDLEKGIDPPALRFTDNADGTVTDKATGLMWVKDAGAGNRTWANALIYCNDLDYAGYTDWRLPNLRELCSLVDLSNIAPALPTGHPFVGVSTSNYWTSTTYRGTTDNAWPCWVYYGLAGTSVAKTTAYATWPVRGPIAP